MRPRSSSGPGRRPLTAETGVRFPYGVLSVGTINRERKVRAGDRFPYGVLSVGRSQPSAQSFTFRKITGQGRAGSSPPSGAGADTLRPAIGRLAQLVRALGSHPRGRRFESYIDHPTAPAPAVRGALTPSNRELAPARPPLAARIRRWRRALNGSPGAWPVQPLRAGTRVAYHPGW